MVQNICNFLSKPRFLGEEDQRYLTYLGWAPSHSLPVSAAFGFKKFYDGSAVTLLRQVQCSFACNEFSTTSFWICGWCKGWTYFTWLSVNQTFVAENLPFIDHFHIQSFGISSLELRVFPRSDCRIAATPKTDGENIFLGWSFIFPVFELFDDVFLEAKKRWIASHRRYPAAQLWFYPKRSTKQ